MDRRQQHRLSHVPETAILGLAILIVLAVGTLSYINAIQTSSRIIQLRAARDVQKLSNQLLLTVTDAETGQRGFLLTGKEQYLKPYDQALSEIPGIWQRLEARSESESDQSQRLRALRPVVTAKLDELRKTILVRRAGSRDAVSIVNSGRGKALMDEIRERCLEINRVAELRIAGFNAASDLSTSRLRVGSTFGSMLLLALVVMSAVTISRGFKRREELFQQAQATRELLATTLSSIADAVVSTDPAARVTFMNPVAERLTGWSEQEATGRNIRDVFPIVNETSNEKVDNPLEQALAKGQPVGLANHTKLVARNGVEISIDDSAAPIRNAAGVIIGAVLVFRDISEKRKAELDAVAAAEALKRSNEELQQFAFSASHDLRSPLNSVNAIAQLLAKRFGPALGEEGNQMIGFINEGVGRMSRLIEDLLALAMASSIARDITHPTSAEDAFQTALKSLSAEVQKAGATITSSSPLPMVAVRDTHVIQVMQNILGNALKYRGVEPPLISVSAVREGAEWVISVRDNGIGFDPKYAHQIFEPFKRLHGHEYEGSGIGLSTCNKIVSVYGGRIWAESESGKGSTFFFSLPEAVAATSVASGDS